MALIECKNCKKKISDKSEKCIHCGTPLNKIEKPKTIIAVTGTNGKT